MQKQINPLHTDKYFFIPDRSYCPEASTKPNRKHSTHRQNKKGSATNRFLFDVIAVKQSSQANKGNK
jgi:hypothetical protein